MRVPDPFGLRRTSDARRASGFTIFEVTLSVAMLAVFLGSILATTVGLQNAFIESQTISEMNLRSQRAMDRLVSLASQALTSDTYLTTLWPDGVGDSCCLRFSLVSGVDSVTGNVLFDNTNLVYLSGTNPSVSWFGGLTVSRGFGMSAVLTEVGGSDAVLGTTDDLYNNQVGGVPKVELLIPAAFQPRTGKMLVADLNGQLVTLTITVNAKGPDGDFLLDSDLVLSERVALRQ